MSNEAITWARQQTGLSTVQKFLLWVLADLADEAHSCYPGQDYLAREVEATPRTVRTALAVLEERGLIVREERRRASGYRTSDRYYLQLPEKSSGRRISPEIDADLTGKDFRLLKDDPLVRTLSSSSADAVMTEAFDLAYGKWPKKVDRKEALKRWPKAVKESGRTARELAAIAVAHAHAYASRETRFVPSFAVWLNKARWDDDIAAINQAAPARDNRITTKYLEEG